MPYDEHLADRVREYLFDVAKVRVKEQEMFGGIVFLVHEKMCINVSKDRLMIRFDPERTEELSEKEGYEPMRMKGKEIKGYCMVEPEGFKTKKQFEFWMKVGLEFNAKAKPSKLKTPIKKSTIKTKKRS